MKLETDDLGNLGFIVADWNYDKPFKARTITTDYTTWIAYVSRKDVPAGIELTNNEYWKPLMRVQAEMAFNYNQFKDYIIDKVNNLSSIVSSFLASSGGTALSDRFGDSEKIGVNQKVLTNSINKIWSKIEDITGELLQGINMVVTPDFYVGEGNCKIHITANTVEANGIFEHIAFYLNDKLLVEADNVNNFTYDSEINGDTVVKCVAKIMGVEHIKEKAITRFNSFWIGGGKTYNDVMNSDHVVSVNDNLRGVYDIYCERGDYIIIIIGSSLRKSFIRADMNSFEILFDEKLITIDGAQYSVFTSKNAYKEGKYNIDVNG